MKKLNLQRFAEEEDLEEIPENVDEQTTEEVAGNNTANTEESTKVEEKLYSQADMEKRIAEENARFNESLQKKMANKERKIRKEYEKKYSGIENVLKAGLGATDMNDAESKLREYWTNEGVEIPQVTNQEYSDDELKILADYDAKEIIEAGYEDIVEEVERLAKLGVENMSKRDKIVFEKLANERIRLDNEKSLKSVGIDTNILKDEKFTDFAKMFNNNVPITKVVEMYNEKNAEPVTQIGSLKNNDTKIEKTFYTPEEAKKLTRNDLKDPKVFEAVRQSMTKWEKGS